MIDPSLMRYLTPQQAERMRAFEQMFSSEGWKFLLSEMQSQYEAAKVRVLGADNWAANRVATGQMGVLGSILRLEETFAREFENAAQEGKVAQQLEDMDAELEYE
jgi:hypothetical protein